ncbi:hypothetical protein D3C75_626900 [compost metagenome]
MFDNDRIQRHCSIITDRDIQAVEVSSSFYSENAEIRGGNRQAKLNRLFENNPWVSTFYAENTFEVEFAKRNDNLTFISRIIDINYSDAATIQRHKKALKGTDQERANTVLTLAKSVGKGWYATLLASKIDESVQIPPYILSAIAFACQEVITTDIKFKMVSYSLSAYGVSNDEMLSIMKGAVSVEEKEQAISRFCEIYPSDIVSLFLEKMDNLYLG